LIILFSDDQISLYQISINTISACVLLIVAIVIAITQNY